MLRDWNVTGPIQILVRKFQLEFKKRLTTIDTNSPAPPSPGVLAMNSEQHMPLPPASHYGTNASVVDPSGRLRNSSPPPPPLPEEINEPELARHRVMPAEANLPGWVPKDYIDKGRCTNLDF